MLFWLPQMILGLIIPAYLFNWLKLRFRFKNLTDMMLQEGGSPQTEQQMSEMIKENLTLSVKKGKNHALPLIGSEVYCH